MNRLTMVLLFLCVCVIAFGYQVIPSPSEPRVATDLLGEISASGEQISSATALLYTGPGYITIRNMDAAGDYLFYGDSDITATSGMVLMQYEQVTIGLAVNESLYGVASGTQTVDIRKMGGR